MRGDSHMGPPDGDIEPHIALRMLVHVRDQFGRTQHSGVRVAGVQGRCASAVVPRCDPNHTQGSVQLIRHLGDEKSINRYMATFDGLCESALPALNADGSQESYEHRDSWGLVQHILYTYIL
jgi:hypothetical protein